MSWFDKRTEGWLWSRDYRKRHYYQEGVALCGKAGPAVPSSPVLFKRGGPRLNMDARKSKNIDDLPTHCTVCRLKRKELSDGAGAFLI